MFVANVHQHLQIDVWRDWWPQRGGYKQESGVEGWFMSLLTLDDFHPSC